MAKVESYLRLIRGDSRGVFATCARLGLGALARAYALVVALRNRGYDRAPGGLLREPVRSLRRAGIVVISRADLVSPDELVAIRARAERAAGPLKWAHARHRPVALIGSGVDPLGVEALERQKVAAFCGIGNPD